MMKNKPKTALVVEGGGMRGVFSAGVLDYFLENGFDPFDLYIGVSAGACNLASHLGNQHGRNYRSYTDYMRRPEFFSLKKFLRGGHYMDLDWFWDHIAGIEPLNVKGASERELYIGVTNVGTGKAEYIKAREDTLLDALKMSSAVPLMYREPLTMNGAAYLDGGIVDPIPFEEAYRRGARKIMVIRSQTSEYHKSGSIESTYVPLLFWRYPQLKTALKNRAARYNQILGILKRPPNDVELIELCPSVLHVGRTTRDKSLLDLDYAEGRRIGQLVVQSWT